MIALGLLLALFTYLPSAQDSAEGLPSVQPVDYVSLMDSHSYDYLSHGNHQCEMYSDSRDAAIEEAKVYCSSHSDCGGFAVSQGWESFCPQFFSLNPTTYDNSAWTFFVKSEEVFTSMEAVRFTTSDSGDNCDNACEAIGEECIEDMLFLQSAEEVASWALEVGVACREILDRCDIGESPIFLEENGVCTFCSNPNHPGWDNGNRCGAQWHIRQRICPCTSTLAGSKSTVTPEESTTELPDDYGFVQGGLCGENWTDMMRGAIELSRNNEEPAKDPMECAKLTAENSECGSYFVQRNDYHVCWCMSKQGVHADCSIRDDWQIHSSGNSYGSIYKLFASSTSSPTTDPTFEPTINPTLTPTANPSDIPSGSPTSTSIFRLSPYNTPADFTFRLRGDMGTESVTIRDGGLSETIVLSQEWTEFVAFSSTIAIEFTNDDGFNRDIDFESNFETNIIAHQLWSNWDCDSDNENFRCQIVRNGRFNWDAIYLITFGEEITVSSAPSYAPSLSPITSSPSMHPSIVPSSTPSARPTNRPSDPEAKFTTSQPGQSCKDACESIEEECRADMLFLQSAEEVASWALAVGVTCTSIVEKCSHAVAPLFNWSHPKFTNNELVCTFCSEPKPSDLLFGTVCNARFASFTRICPCSSTWSSPPTQTPTTSPTLAGYEGSMCNVDDDCDSERCNLGEFPSRCREKENHSNECNRDGDCESDLCLGRKCVDGRDNDRCNSNDDCQSGRCAYGIPFGNCQAPAEHGENCIRNNDCASQHCLLSTCTDHRDGAHCANDDDCLEGSSCVWSKTGATCEKNHGCTWWNWNECSEKCTWFQKVTFTCY